MEKESEPQARKPVEAMLTLNDMLNRAYLNGYTAGFEAAVNEFRELMATKQVPS